MQAYASDLQESLNFERILPLLVESHILSEADQKLFQSSLSQNEKVSKLINLFPDKNSQQALQKFVACLKATSEGTAHGDIAHQIEELAGKFTPSPVNKSKFGYCCCCCFCFGGTYVG